MTRCADPTLCFDRRVRSLALLVLLGACAVEPPPSDEPPGESAPAPASLRASLGATHFSPVEFPRLEPIPSPITSVCPAAAPSTLFTDVSDCAGITALHHVDEDVDADWWTSGQAWADLDGDGILDLLTTSQKGENHVYLGRTDGTFDRVQPSGGEELKAGAATLQDLNGDGIPDVHLTATGPDSILLGDGAGRLTPPVGGQPFQHPGLGNATAWADYDADGDLDAYTANYLCWQCDALGDTTIEWASDTFWRSDGAGGFEETGELLGDPWLRAGMGCQPAWFDFDNDGDLDLYVANDKGEAGEPHLGEVMNRNVLWRNDGPGCGGHCFVEVAKEVGLDARKDAMCLAIGDYDNDLDLDVFMTDTITSLLLQNQGDGTYIDVTLPAGVGDNFEGWGCVWLDYDNDGWLDLYAAGGRNEEDHLWRNRGDGTFEDRTAEGGASDPQHTLGVATADYDEDGAVDLVVATWNDRYRLYRNTSAPEGDWLGLRLVGRGAGGTDAVGARAFVTTDDGLVQMREVKIGSSLGSGNATGLHFGLGDRRIRSILVRWPDGAEQAVAAPHNTWSVVERTAP